MNEGKEKLLTSLELKVMNHLWDMKKAFVKEVIEAWGPDSKPAYNTISTVVRNLEEKGFVGHESFGRSHRYFPVVSRVRYQKRAVKNVLDSVFSGSVTSLVSTIVDNRNLSDEELLELREMIDRSE